VSDPCRPIAFVSNASWHCGLPTNRQQLPKSLAKHTHVLYSSPFSLSQALMGKVSLRQYRRGLTHIHPNLSLFEDLQLLPMVRGRIPGLKRLDEWLITRSLKHYMRMLRFNDPILWLYYPPSFQYLIGQLGEALTCYHCTDDHAGYARALGMDDRQVAEAETLLVRAVDVVLTTSRPLYEKHLKLNPHTHLMPNVADVDSFTPIAEGRVDVAPELRRLPRPVAGFAGAVSSYKVDLDLVARTAQAMPGWSFVFIGPVGTGDGTREADLPRLPNVHYLGQQAYKRLPSYVAGFDVCMIPYRLNDYTSAVFPLKFWEYLASGKPVVTTPLPALSEYRSVVEIAGSPAQFAEALKKALISLRDTRATHQRLELAAGQSWDCQAERMLETLSKYA
jgi:glycosyltransferase involved in cell wall biosynthesis